MIETEGKILKWGNSIGIRISKDDLIGSGIGVEDPVEVKITKKYTKVKDIFGIIKKKIDTQKSLKAIDEEFGGW